MKNNLILILIILLSIFFCCKQSSDGNNLIIESQEKLLEFQFEDSEVSVLMRDTVFRDKDYKCLITYKTPKDSLKKYINGKNFRNLFFSFIYTDTLVDDIKIIKNKLTDTIFSITENNELYSGHIKFKKLGVNYIDGILKDQIYLMQADSSNYRLISDEYRLNFKVFVIDSIGNNTE